MSLEPLDKAPRVVSGGPPKPREGVPLRAMLKLPALAGAQVVAGREGLGRMVRNVNVMEVPDIVPWVKPDELLLTTAYPLKDDALALSELVPRLAEKGLAAIAVKPARYIAAIPSAMIEQADRLGFPLLELPPEASFNDIINAVLTVILNAQAARLQRAAEIHDRFTRIVLGGGGLPQIAEALAGAISRPVAILDPQGLLLARAADPALAMLSIGQSVPLASEETNSTSLRPVVARLGDRSVDALLQPVRVGTEVHGAVLVIAELSQLQGDDLEAVEYAATVTALRQVQARSVSEADGRFQAVCLEELVTGHVEDRGRLMERAGAFSWDLNLPRAVLVAAIEAAPRAQRDERRIRQRLTEAARVSLGRSAIIWERSLEVAALIAPSARGSGIRELAEQFQAEVRRRAPEVAVGIGVGRVRDDPLELDRSYSEARQALEVGRWSRGIGQVFLFEELGLDRFLLAADGGERTAFVQSTIGPLLTYDRAHETELCGTLESYLATRNASAVSRAGYIHYNTLKNRLARCEDILGRFLDDPERCLAIALALRVARLPLASSLDGSVAHAPAPVG